MDNEATQSERIAALIALGRKAEASRIIVSAVRAAHGNKRDAAAVLCMSHVTLYRLISQLSLWSTLDELAASKGWRMRAGATRNIVSVLAAALVVGLSGACAADGAYDDDAARPATYTATAGSAPIADNVAGSAAPAPEVDAAVKPSVTPTESDAAVVVVAPPPAVVAGAPAPPPPPAAAGAPAPELAGAAAPPPVAAAVTSCKLTTGQRVDCSAESRHIWVNTSLFWSGDKTSAFNGPTYNCEATNAPACVAGNACAQYNTSTHATTDGVCQ